MNYVGIDLGTTNSAICSYDGETVRLYKSPDQHDVTPSAIFLDRRGNKYVGARAYNNAARDPENAAVLFKRLMGTSTPIALSAVKVTMTPEECSAEILRTLFGYLPEEIRNDGNTGTVITVPAAFNQMQKDATMAAC
jgi:molecular chaperone DnaK